MNFLILLSIFVICLVYGFPNIQAESAISDSEDVPKPSPIYSFKCTSSSYKSTLLDSKGFVEVNYFANVPNFVLNPGGKGIISYNLESLYDFPDRFENYTINSVLENKAIFYEREDLILEHFIGSQNKTGSDGQIKTTYLYSYKVPDGPRFETTSETKLENTINIPTNKQVNPNVHVTFEPVLVPVEKILKPENDPNFIVNATINVDLNATRGTYWLSFNENPCKGTPFFLFTVGDSAYAGDEDDLRSCPYGYPPVNNRACFEFTSPVFFQNSTITGDESTDQLIPIKTEREFFKIREPLEIVYQNTGVQPLYFRDFWGHLTITNVENGNVVKGPMNSSFLEPLILQPGQSQIIKIPLEKNMIPGNYTISVQYEKENELFPEESRPKYEILASIGCPNDLQFIKKINGDSACVKSSTAAKLIGRGWGLESFHLDDYDQIYYQILNQKISPQIDFEPPIWIIEEEDYSIFLVKTYKGDDGAGDSIMDILVDNIASEFSMDEIKDPHSIIGWYGLKGDYRMSNIYDVSFVFKTEDKEIVYTWLSDLEKGDVGPRDEVTKNLMLKLDSGL